MLETDWARLEAIKRLFKQDNVPYDSVQMKFAEITLMYKNL